MLNKYAYITNFENKNWISDMSNGEIPVVSFKAYLKDLFVRDLEKIISLFPIIGGVSKEDG